MQKVTDLKVIMDVRRGRFVPSRLYAIFKTWYTVWRLLCKTARWVEVRYILSTFWISTCCSPPPLKTSNKFTTIFKNILLLEKYISGVRLFWSLEEAVLVQFRKNWAKQLKRNSKFFSSKNWIQIYFYFPAKEFFFWGGQ